MIITPLISTITVGIFSSIATADVTFWSTFFSPSTVPNPDPLYKKLGDFVYYEKPNAPWTPNIAAKGMFIPHAAEYELTVIRVAQPEIGKGGTLSIWTVDVSNPLNPIPGVKLGELGSSTTLLSGGGGVIQSWDFSQLNVILAPSVTHYLVLDAPMMYYGGILSLDASKVNGKWNAPFPAEPLGPAFEVRGNKVPGPNGLAVVMLGGVMAIRRRR